jgi:hypothetical protein
VNGTATVVTVAGLKSLDGYLVSTSAHLFVDSHNNVLIPDRSGNPKYSAYTVYLPACQKSPTHGFYKVTSGALGTTRPAVENDRDFAVIKLATRACNNAAPMPLVSSTSDDFNALKANSAQISTVGYYDPASVQQNVPVVQNSNGTRLASIGNFEAGSGTLPLPQMGCFFSTGALSGVDPSGRDVILYDVDTDFSGSGGPLILNPDSEQPAVSGVHVGAAGRMNINGGIRVDDFVLSTIKQFATSNNDGGI